VPPRTRAFVEQLGNGVTMETVIKDGNSNTRIVYLAVKKNGRTLFKKTIKHRSLEFAAEVARLRNTIALAASQPGGPESKGAALKLFNSKEVD